MRPRGPPQPHHYAQPGIPGQPGMPGQPGQQVPFVHNSFGQTNSLDPYAQGPYAQASPYGMPNPQVRLQSCYDCSSCLATLFRRVCQS
jgi:hypothetical protein